MKYYPSVNPGKKSFYVPADTIENIDMCTAQQLRVLLLALSSNNGCDKKIVAEKLNITEDDADDLLEYWVKRNILTYDNNTGLNTPFHDKEIVNLKPPEIKPTMKEIEILSKNPNVEFVLNESQRIMGSSFTTSDTSTIVWLLEWAGILPEVLLTIIQYCVDNNKNNFRYIQKTALDWLDSGINTLEAADEKIRILRCIGSWENELKNALCIKNRDLTTKEKEFSEIWRSMEIPIELIHYAYEKCIDNTNKLSFAYINRIIINWKQKGIDSLEKALSDQKEKSSNNDSAPSFDISEIDKRMRLEDSVI